MNKASISQECGHAEHTYYALNDVDRIPLGELIQEAEHLTLAGHGQLVTYSRKVFIPLTRLCRDICHYCTFASTPRMIGHSYLTLDEVLAIARAGQAAGCREALFTLGDRPEDRHPSARTALDAMGYSSTLDYLRAAASLVLTETGLLPHLNPGLMDDDALARLRPVSASMGLMLETLSPRLSAKGGPHYGSPDKLPARRIAVIESAGRAGVPFTTGLLIGIGETREERIDALRAIADCQSRHGHIQEVIIQNFRAKPDTRMAAHSEPSVEEHLWTIAVARLILGPQMSIQAPPNLHAPDVLADLLRAGVNDWGGVSPVTPDHVNPEAPWPHIAELERATAASGRHLRERLAIGPSHARKPDKWLDAAVALKVRRGIDARGLPFIDDWRAGEARPMPVVLTSIGRSAERARLDDIISRASAGERLGEAAIVRLFEAEGPDAAHIAEASDTLRQLAVGDDVTFVVNRNINYTNICLYKCSFCAFSKGGSRSLRGPGYRLDLDEIGRRAAEAQARGASEVCLQGGIHPDYDGDTYLDIVGAVRAAAPGIHIHAFSPLEVQHGALTLSLSLPRFLLRLKQAGLSTLPGTAAEILDDKVRAIICPDKVDTEGWLEVMRAAHGVGLRSTATIMFGHVDNYWHWASHLLHIRDLQCETAGFTEFVPLPFVHMAAPRWRKGNSRSGPSSREALMMHAISRLVLHGLISNIQASWVKLGASGVVAVLRAGANDLGGTLMDESITRAAGGVNGQLCDADAFGAIASGAGRPLRQRTTLYGTPAPTKQTESVR